VISIIIPTQRSSSDLQNIRVKLQDSAFIGEIIIVAHHTLMSCIDPLDKNECILFSHSVGRGHKLLEGVTKATGDIILFLHDDTILPCNWDSVILQALEDEQVSGGAFSLRFDIKNFTLTFLIWLSNLFYRITGELWGDRAIFIRAEILRSNLNVLNTPIMEDVNLSYLMKKEGKTLLLSQTVITSAESFIKRGVLSHTLKIMICRFLYFIGLDPTRIHRYYHQ